MSWAVGFTNVTTLDTGSANGSTGPSSASGGSNCSPNGMPRPRHVTAQFLGLDVIFSGSLMPYDRASRGANTTLTICLSPGCSRPAAGSNRNASLSRVLLGGPTTVICVHSVGTGATFCSWMQHTRSCSSSTWPKSTTSGVTRRLGTVMDALNDSTVAGPLRTCNGISTDVGPSARRFVALNVTLNSAESFSGNRCTLDGSMVNPANTALFLSSSNDTGSGPVLVTLNLRYRVDPDTTLPKSHV